jgi:CheY-like chemotaxis protein
VKYVLIAEPNVLRRAHYTSIVASEGLVPVAVADGVEAMAVLASSGVPELLLTELALPLVDGFQVIDRLRRAASPSQSPVLVVSAYRELREDALLLQSRLGIGAVVRATASTEALRQALRSLLGAPEVTLVPPAPPLPAPRPPTLRTVVERPPTTQSSPGVARTPPSSRSGRALGPTESSRAGPISAPPSAT